MQTERSWLMRRPLSCCGCKKPPRIVFFVGVDIDEMAGTWYANIWSFGTGLGAFTDPAADPGVFSKEDCIYET